MKTKPNTAKAWGYLCCDRNGAFTVLAEYASHRKGWWANPPVRVRVIRERDYRKLVKAAIERGNNNQSRERRGIMSIHLFGADMQPATDFWDKIMPGVKNFHFKYSPRHLFRCCKCRRLRWAKNLSVQVYYDGTRFFCREKKTRRGKRGCKQ